MELNLESSSSAQPQALVTSQIGNSQNFQSKSKFNNYNNSNINNYKSQQNNSNNFNVNFHDIKSLFDKKFEYKRSLNWDLPTIITDPVSHYQFDSLQELKEKLNAVKSKLNDYKIEDWSSHTRRRNPAGEIAWRIKNITKAEFVTQAWCKFYECLCQYNLVTGPTLNTIHLCEAPGAFLAALNHFLQANYNLKAFDSETFKSNENISLYQCGKNYDQEIKWNYFATTMNPYHESNPLSNMVMDDRFILHTLENWLFGKDFTGNIINKDNINHMNSEIKQKMQRVDLVTADGSIDCMEKPDFQEEIVSKLHFAEICAAINILSENGNFVLKMFTLFEANSVCLVYFLNCCFREVHVYKPATSKCGNSEIYLICLDLNRNVKNFENYLNFMMDNLNEDIMLFEKNSIPKDFLIQHEICCRMFMSYQISVIESNIKTYLEPSIYDSKKCKFLRQKVVEHYFKIYNILKLPEELKMLYIKNAEVQYEFHTRMYSGSYSERNALKDMSEKEKLANLRLRLMDFEKYLKCEKIVQENFDKFDDNFTLKLYFGKSVSKIESSLFFNIHLLNLRNKIEKILSSSQKLETFSCELINDNSVSKTVNFNSEIGDENFGIKEKIFIKEIVRIILEENTSKVVFNKFPILSHFTASVIKFLWKFIFNNLTIKYKNKYQIIFEGRKSNYNKYLIQLNDILLKSDKLFCLVDIKELHKNLFNNIIVDYNNTLFYNNFKNILSSYSS